MRPRKHETHDFDRIDRRIKAALATGTTQKAIAEALGVSTSVISDRVKAMRERGELAK